MRMRTWMRWTAAASTILLAAGAATAQWPDDPAENLLIADRTGEQTLPKVAATSDGGVYVCWYDHASGNYDVYLQRLDGEGVIQWQVNGLLVSDNPQESWITDYDMTVDPEDHAIIAVNDIRAGGDWDIYGYRISPSGEFVWGTDGLTLSDNTNFEPDPRVCVTSAGNIVFAWQEETAAGNVINLRKVSPEGADLWDPATITLSSEYGLSIPRIIPAENDGVILQYLDAQGSMFWDPKYLYMQKFDSLGTAQWTAGGVGVSTTVGGFGPQMRPDLAPDGSGGAFSFWYESRNMENHVYAQHVLPDGSMQWTADGVQASTTPGQLQTSPSLAVVPGAGGVILFYEMSNSGQTLWGLGGQYLTPSGQRGWGDGGLILAPLGDQQRYHVRALPQDGGAIVVYFEFVPGSAVNALVKAARVDTSGTQPWTTSPEAICSVAAGKGHHAATVNHLGQVISVWGDDRMDASGDIYLQNVNPDGTLGAYGAPPEPPAIAILAPEDGAELDSLPVDVVFSVWNFWIAETDGDGLLRVTVNGELYNIYTSEAPFAIDTLTEGENRIALELVDYDTLSLDPPVADSVTVTYVVSGVTAGANGQPAGYRLGVAYPNPFNPTVLLRYSLARPGRVELEVFDVTGRRVAVLTDGVRAAGEHVVTWDAADAPSGVYFVRMTAGGFHAARKVVRVK